MEAVDGATLRQFKTIEEASYHKILCKMQSASNAKIRHAAEDAEPSKICSKRDGKMYPAWVSAHTAYFLRGNYLCEKRIERRVRWDEIVTTYLK